MILMTGATLGVVAGLVVYYLKTLNRREQLYYEETANGSSELVTGC